MRGWPGFAGMEPEAAAGARGFAGPALQLTNEGAEALEGLYGSRLAQRCTPVTKWSLGFRRRRVRAAERLGEERRGGYGMLERKRRGGG